jgi:HNH endonuclease
LAGSDGICCSDPRRPKGGFWLSPQFHAWPEMESLGLEAVGGFVACGSWATEYQHPEMLPVLLRMCGVSKRAAAELVNSGLWSRPGDRYRTKTLSELRQRDGCRGRVMLVSRLMRSCQETLYAGTAALGLWALAASWSLTTDDPGFIPARTARMLGTRKTIEALRDSILWIDDLGGYLMAVSDHPREAYWALGRDDDRMPIAPEVRERVLARDGHRCVRCGSAARLEVDHIWPWSLGGPDTEDNLQTLCKSCNVSKGARVR